MNNFMTNYLAAKYVISMISSVGEIKSIFLGSKGEYKVLKILVHSSKLFSS